MSLQNNTKLEGLSEDLPLLKGGVSGLVTFVAGYLATGLLIGIESGGESSLEGDYVLEVVGLIFFNAQFVDIQQTLMGESESLNLLSKFDWAVPVTLFYVVPIVLLIVAGFALARKEMSSGRSTAFGPRAGATVVTGYLPAVLVGRYLFTFEESSAMGTFNFSPELSTSVLVAGIALPLVCGAVGGLIASTTR